MNDKMFDNMPIIVESRPYEIPYLLSLFKE